jgi:hypothetical protein
MHRERHWASRGLQIAGRSGWKRRSSWNVLHLRFNIIGQVHAYLRRTTFRTERGPFFHRRAAFVARLLHSFTLPRRQVGHKRGFGGAFFTCMLHASQPEFLPLA